MPGKPGRVIVTDVSPAEAKLVWDTLPHPSATRVAARFRSIGRPISANAITKWKKNGWREANLLYTAHQHAAGQLDKTVALLTGDPTTGLADVAPYPAEFPNPNGAHNTRAIARTENISAITAMIDNMTDVELLRTLNKRAQGFVAVIMEEASTQRKNLVSTAPDQLGRLIESCARMLEVANDGAAKVLDIEERKMKTVSNLSQVDADVLDAIAVPEREDRPAVEVLPPTAPPQPLGFVPPL